MSNFSLNKPTTTTIKIKSGPTLPDCLKNITSGLAALDITATSTSLIPIAPNGPGKGNTSASQPLIVDIEFQDYHVTGETHPMDHRDETKRGKRKCRNRLAWICVRNFDDIILDCFVRYEYEYPRVKRILTEHHATFGVTAERLMERNGAVDGWVVEEWCVALFKDRPIVLHGGQNDLKAFYYEDAFAGASEIIDTQHTRGQRSLSGLYYELFGEEIQEGGKHSAVEDTAATNRIFKLSSSYDREAERAKFELLSDAQKEAHHATGPVVKYEHYQGNKVAGMPTRSPPPESSMREPRPYKGKGKGRATGTDPIYKTINYREQRKTTNSASKRSAGNITLQANGDINLTAGGNINLHARGAIKINTGSSKTARMQKPASKGFSYDESDFPTLGKK